MYQYVFIGESEWTEKRIKQLQALKDIAFKVIDFISQFEDELVRIWNKPKFVLNSNYVITLDRIESKGGIKLIKKLLTHENFEKQVDEWKELGIVESNFNKNEVLENTLSESRLSKKYQHLPIDTKYFKDLELEILGLFDNLDNSLDGWLIHSENYQALNTILPKFKEKVQTIYIDPPFNTGEDFHYIDKFQDATWLTLMENRLQLAREMINKTGSLFLHLDYRANYYGRILLENIFNKENFVNEIIYGYRIQGINRSGLPNKHQTIFFYSKNHNNFYFKSLKEEIAYEKPFIDTKVKNPNYSLSQEKIKHIVSLLKKNKPLPDKYKDLLFRKYYSVVFVRDVWDNDKTKPLISGSKEYLKFSTQKSEALLKRILNISSQENNLVLDLFLGSGTTTAVAHKLRRKWIGVEMGEQFWTVVLPRMKEVLAGFGNHEPCGISKDINWQGGGFFKYYELEQYEDTLKRTKYKDSDLFDNPYEDPYNQYIFMKDEKLLNALEIDYKNNKVKVDLSKLYKDIDIPETLSNLRGKWIKRIGKDFVEFEDGAKVNLKNLDYIEFPNGKKSLFINLSSR